VKCLKCKSDNTHVLETRGPTYKVWGVAAVEGEVLRRRECNDCKFQWVTIEATVKGKEE